MSKINRTNLPPDTVFCGYRKEDDVRHTKDPEKVNYMITFVGVDLCSDKEFSDWDYHLGRTEVRETLKSLVENKGIDIHSSKVFSEETTIMNAPSVFEFFKSMEGLYDDGFNIEIFNV